MCAFSLHLYDSNISTSANSPTVHAKLSVQPDAGFYCFVLGTLASHFVGHVARACQQHVDRVGGNRGYSDGDTHRDSDREVSVGGIEYGYSELAGDESSLSRDRVGVERYLLPVCWVICVVCLLLGWTRACLRFDIAGVAADLLPHGVPDGKPDEIMGREDAAMWGAIRPLSFLQVK